MKRLYIISLLFFLSMLNANAQKLSVESFAVKTNDLTARTQPRQDNNGDDCALLKVLLASPDASFKGSVMGEVSYDKSEYRVYMPKGSKRLTVQVEGYLPLEVAFEDYGIKALEGRTVYVLTVAGVIVNGQQQEARAKTGWIILDSEPQGASVYINEEYVGTTPLDSYKQTYGTYSYRLEYLNYHPSGGTIELNAERVEQKIGLKPAFGTIDVTSSAAGASVFLDGKPTGMVTPCRLEEVPSGNHTVAFQLENYAPQQLPVTVEDGKTSRLSATLAARFAQVTIKSVDGAQIFSNGSQIGEGSYAGDLIEGYYDLEVRLAHHRHATKQIQVVAGQPQEVTLNPVPIFGSLDVLSTPRDAEISVDGKSYGKTPFTIERLLEGEHTVTLAKDGYVSQSVQVTVSEGDVAQVSVELSDFNPYTASLEEITSLAEKGNAQAQYLLGKHYEDLRQYDLVVKWYTKSAEQDYAGGLNGLGWCYLYGRGVEKDYAKAVDLLTKAANKNWPSAYMWLASYYNSDIGGRDSLKAEELLRKSEELMTKWEKLGVDIDDLFQLGLRIGIITRMKGEERGLYWISESAEMGHPSAQFRLGRHYYYRKDYAQSIEWFTKVVEQGAFLPSSRSYLLYESLSYLGNHYYYGYGTSQNYQKAVECYTKAVASPYEVEAQNMLGECYELGRGVQKNHGTALEWYRKAADTGLPLALFNMGRCYEFGIGVSMSYPKAIEWYKKAVAEEYDEETSQKAKVALRRMNAL